QGNPAFGFDHERSIPLAAFAPIAALPGVTLVSLQKGFGREQLAGLKTASPVIDWTAQMDNDAAFVDTAALMSSLDLVITSDTALAHLAGALGIRTWIALGFTPDWRWMMDRSDSPWYPNMRLFRQKVRGQWNDVLQEIAVAVKQLING